MLSQGVCCVLNWVCHVGKWVCLLSCETTYGPFSIITYTCIMGKLFTPCIMDNQYSALWVICSHGVLWVICSQGVLWVICSQGALWVICTYNALWDFISLLFYCSSKQQLTAKVHNTVNRVRFGTQPEPDRLTTIITSETHTHTGVEMMDSYIS